MTTPDSKYKHKPSEKHTLEEVLKSLQDLIRNDLLDKDRSDASTETARAAPIPPKEKPNHERIELTREDFAPTSPAAGPVNLDAVMRSLKDLIGNELNIGDEPAPPETVPTAPASEQPDTIKNTSEEFLSLAEELSVEGPAESTIGTEAAYSEQSIVPTREPSVVNETAAEEFIPLDEELTFDESTDIAPLPPTVSVVPDIPGEISPELLDRPEEATQPKSENNIAPEIQQELLFDEPSLSASEHTPATIGIAPEMEQALDTAPALMDTVSAVASEPPAENSNPIVEETLPIIEVEETFDVGAYFETETRQAEPSSSDAQEIEEIIASALDAPLASESLPPAATSSGGETPSQNLASAPKPDKAPANEGIKLEIIDEPAIETRQNTPSVDFDTIDSGLPNEKPDRSPLTIETPAPEAVPESKTRAEVPPSPAIMAETIPQPEAGTTPHGMTTPHPPGETEKTTREIVPNKSKPAFNLDDIPVLNEVVAPPAGSTLVAEPVSPVAGPPLPAPDRARDIVVRAVAKLNVEMRKTGGPGLDTKTILRLQQLIRQELEKDGDKS